jgi:hypothetical protein
MREIPLGDHWPILRRQRAVTVGGAAVRRPAMKFATAAPGQVVQSADLTQGGGEFYQSGRES